MNRTRYFLPVLLAVGMLTACWNSQAAIDMFLKIPDVPGESVDKLHAGEIDVLAWSWGLANAGSSQPGTAGKVNVQDLSFTKWVDKASPKLMLGVCNGKHFPEAVLTLRKAGDRPFEFLKITLSEVVVSSVSTGGSGGEDRLTENVTLRFSKVKVEYTVQKPDGTKGEVVTFGWDLAGNVALP